MSTVGLSKLHATGNDFLVVDGRALELAPPSADTAARLCDRRRGIGADGLIVVVAGDDDFDCGMLLRNADGSLAEMSGNGIRCLAWVAQRGGLVHGDRLSVATGRGLRDVHVRLGPHGDVVAATVDMGPVTFDPPAIPVATPDPFDLEATFHGVTYRGDAAGMGNPHFVLFVDDVASARVTQHGPHLELDDRFPNRTNVEFVSVGAPREVTIRVWERGVGETLSCGTGACAVAAVAHRRGLVGDHVVVHVPGGDLTVDLGDTIRLGGPVVHVFDCDVDPGDYGWAAP